MECRRPDDCRLTVLPADKRLTSLAHCLLMEGGVTMSVPAVHAGAPCLPLEPEAGLGRCSIRAMLSTVLPKPCAVRSTVKA